MQKSMWMEVSKLVNTIYKAVDRKGGKELLQLLADCQDSAIQIGETIEETEGMGHITVTYLEEFAELLYDASMSLLNEESYKPWRDKLTKSLKIIRKSIKEDIPVKYNVLFLPYKSSMWDSLESIWKATYDDVQCESYVMPIPYTVRDEKSEIIYEGNAFPENVSVLDYRKTTMKDIAPDVIFIHNPFDQNNNVTAVLPEFHSSVLLQYTSNIVYVPYYVCTTKVSEGQCCQLGVHNAKYVIVQSEEIKKQFVNYYGKAINKQNVSDKFLPLGSPKVDRLQAAMQGEVIIPDEWKLKCRGKRVLFFNTTLNLLINRPQSALAKIRSVLKLSSEMDDVVILWRPHPLSSATLGSMQPAYLKEYEEIVAWCQSEENIIYDTSADFYAAFVCSDAYCGNESSLLALYGLTGKPIFLTSPELRCFLWGTVIDGWLWTNDIFRNKFYRVNVTSGEVEFVKSYSIDNPAVRGYYQKTVCYKDKIYFIPLRGGKNIIELNRKDYRVNYLPLETKSKDQQYREAFIYDNFLHLFPGTTEPLAILNLESGEIVYKELPPKDSDGVYGESEEYSSAGVQVGNVAWIACGNDSYCIKYDLKNGTNELVTIPVKSKGYVGIAAEDKLLYLLDKKGDIIRWNPKENSAEIWWEQQGDIAETLFDRIEIGSNFLWLIPNKNNCIIKIHKETKQEEKLFFEKDFLSDGMRPEYCRVGKHIYFYPQYANHSYLLDLEMDVFQKTYKLKFTNCAWEQEKGESYKDYLKWEKDLYIEQFIESLGNRKAEASEIQKQAFQALFANSDGTCGERTWMYLKEKML